jgi:isoquinoline 1-oxidoreductase beta subunit
MAAQPTSVKLPYVGDVMFKDGVDFFTTTGAVETPTATRRSSSSRPTWTPEFRSWCGGRSATRTPSSPESVPWTKSPSPPGATPSIWVETCSRATRAPCGPSSWPPRSSTGTHHRPKVPPEASPAAAFSAPTPKSPRSPSTAHNRVHVERIVFTLDCGIASNPDLIRGQIQGGLLWGFSAAAWGEIVLADGGDIVTQNFDRYPVMRVLKNAIDRVLISFAFRNKPLVAVGYCGRIG